jgi:ABC-2 type transport system ATP-binding protein
MSEQPLMIEAENLTKYFGSFVAVFDASFKIGKGELVAFLGPNGAGKSTTMKMLTGYLSPSAGRARITGIDVAEDRIAAAEKVGYLPENGPLYHDMVPEDLLRFFGKARGMSADRLNRRIEEVVEICGISDVRGKRIGKLSRGYRQRVGLAQALLHEPDVLILDEPTSGLDPNQIQDVREALRQIAKERTVLLSTHLFQEVEALATRVILIANGEIAFDGKPEEMKNQGGGSMEEAFHVLTQSSPAAAQEPTEVAAS